MLMTYDQDSYTVFQISIYNRVWKKLQRECPSSARRECSKTGMVNQEFGDMFKFFEKTLSDHDASLFP